MEIELNYLHRRIIRRRQPPDSSNKKGKGVHHVAYRVDDLEVALEELKEQGIRTLEHTLRINKHGRRLIYLNPADTEGTIIEYCDYPEEK